MYIGVTYIPAWSVGDSLESSYPLFKIRAISDKPIAKLKEKLNFKVLSPKNNRIASELVFSGG